MANEILKVQKLANSSAKSIQKMINKANEKALKFNADEAKKARDFNAKEAATARTFNANEAQIARLFNAEEAQKARDWQTDMSNTAHQREVEDLKKAGLNPVLSAGAGAQSYTTSSASAGAASANNASAGAASGSVESGAGAISSIFSGLMSAMTGLEQTRLQSQSAIRASEISASASRYVADQNLKAAQYTADKGYQKEMDKPQGSPFAIVDKYFGKSVANGIKKVASSDMSSNKTGTISLNSNGKKTVDAGLLRLGIDINKVDSRGRAGVRSSYVKMVNYGDSKAAQSLSNMSKKGYYKSSKTYSPFQGNNWNPYNNGYN